MHNPRYYVRVQEHIIIINDTLNICINRASIYIIYSYKHICMAEHAYRWHVSSYVHFLSQSSLLHAGLLLSAWEGYETSVIELDYFSINEIFLI